MLLTDWMSSIIAGPFLSCLPKLVSFFFSVGVKFQKTTQTHTHTYTQHLRNTFAGRCPEKQLPRCQLMPSEPRNQNFPSARRQRVPALRRMRPLQSLVNLWYNFWWFLPPKDFKDMVIFKLIVGVHFANFMPSQ